MNKSQRNQIEAIVDAARSAKEKYDSNLAAHAPELLAALKALVATHPAMPPRATMDLRDDLKAAVQAIAKAEGVLS